MVKDIYSFSEKLSLKLDYYVWVSTGVGLKIHNIDHLMKKRENTFQSSLPLLIKIVHNLKWHLVYSSTSLMPCDNKFIVYDHLKNNFRK